MEDKLLFQSGKYTINANGKDALLKLAQVLNQKGDINIMVEGHTDNVPYKSNGSVIKDNLDLSVLRATEVSRILSTDGKIEARRIIAAGRGDTQPLEDNSTSEGRAKNRRTEIILTPKLSELFKMLGD
jgi:chemotaxis protein MotB